MNENLISQETMSDVIADENIQKEALENIKNQIPPSKKRILPVLVFVILVFVVLGALAYYSNIKQESKDNNSIEQQTTQLTPYEKCVKDGGEISDIDPWFNTSTKTCRKNDLDYAETLPINDKGAYKDLFSEIENIFTESVQLQIYQVTDSNVTWYSEEKYLINIPYTEAIVIPYPEKHSAYNYSDKTFVKYIENKFSTKVDNLMIAKGYKLNENNSFSSNFADKDRPSYYYTQAYEKGETKCKMNISPDCSSAYIVGCYAVVFSCTDEYSDNYNAMLPYLKDLELGDYSGISKIEAKTDDFLIASVAQGWGGAMLIAKKIDGKWTQLVRSHEPPGCDLVEEHQIPNEILGVCYEYTSTHPYYEEVENKIGLEE